MWGIRTASCARWSPPWARSRGAITHWKRGQGAGLIDLVSAASREQSQGIEQVKKAVVQMESVTQNTAATAEESAAASEELYAQAETSLHFVAELQELIADARESSKAE